MRILVATDAWHPQINGVVRTLTTLAKAVRKRGAQIEFLTPDGFPSFPLPTYPGMRCAIPGPREIARRIGTIAPDAIHIATEGPIGHTVRRFCIKRGLPFTTSYTTRFPEYISARLPIPESWSYAVLRRFHNASTVTMVSTNSMTEDLKSRGFTNIGMWTRGVDTELFRPDRAVDIGLKRPVFMTVGRVAVEKNIDAFLSLDLPGSKAVIGRGLKKSGCAANIRMWRFSVRSAMSISPRISRPPTFSCFRAAPTPMASFNSRRWPAAFRSRPIR